MAETTWVVLTTSQPSWLNTKVPNEIADLLGIVRDELKTLAKPYRTLVGIKGQPGWVRMVNGRQHADLVAQEMNANRVLGVVLLNDTLIFRVPATITAWLGVETFPREHPGSLGTDDVIAWLVPENEYYAYREATRGGKAYRFDPKAPPAHVYMVKSHFPGLGPSVEEMERERGRPRKVARLGVQPA